MKVMTSADDLIKRRLERKTETLGELLDLPDKESRPSFLLKAVESIDVKKSSPFRAVNKQDAA
jgi:hypothetical protein